MTTLLRSRQQSLSGQWLVDRRARDMGSGRSFGHAS
jgi:hypothetical protein